MHDQSYSKTVYGDADTASQFKQASAPRQRSKRAKFLKWLRQIHLYVGLWGAALGLLFGATGILLNHRAILKIPVDKTFTRPVQLVTPERGFASPEKMSEWLQNELRFEPVAPPIVRSHSSQTLLLSEREFVQPERWNVSLTRPNGAINAEYYVGNRTVRIEHVDATPIGTLTRLHMSVGVNAFWVLLMDTIAGSLIVLSLTGLLLWTQLHTIRTIGVCTSIGALLAGIIFMFSI
jgi:hypothetical protein